MPQRRLELNASAIEHTTVLATIREHFLLAGERNAKSGEGHLEPPHGAGTNGWLGLSDTLTAQVASGESDH